MVSCRFCRATVYEAGNRHTRTRAHSVGRSVGGLVFVGRRRRRRGQRERDGMNVCC